MDLLGIAMIALVSAGPSMEETWNEAVREEGKENYRITVGINSACWRSPFQFDWFCLCDMNAIATCLTDEDRWPKRGFVTSSPSRPVPESLPEKHGGGPLEKEIPWPDWNERRRKLGGCFSFPMCLSWLSGQLEKGEWLHVYGFDAVVDKEWDAGRNAGIDLKTGSHSKRRWNKELPWVALYWNPKTMVRITPKKRKVAKFDRDSWLSRLPESVSFNRIEGKQQQRQ